MSGVYYTPEELRSDNKEGLIQEVYESKYNKDYGDAEIISWQTDLANLYYDKSQTTLDNDGFVHELMLKRNFISLLPLNYQDVFIADNKLFKEGEVDSFLLNKMKELIQNTKVQEDLPSKENNSFNQEETDQFLLKILEEKSKSDEITDIIASIQSNQNKIIRTESSENFVVQGCAGSGKTMILLHRLSYLKFNHRLPEYNTIKIITPSKNFSNFIKNLSTADNLDIEEIEQITNLEYYLKLCDTYLKKYMQYDEMKSLISSKYADYKIAFSKEKYIDESTLPSEIIKALYSKEIFDYIKNEYENIVKSAEVSLTTLMNQQNSGFLNNASYIEYTVQKLNNIHKECQHALETIKEVSYFTIDIYQNIWKKVYSKVFAEMRNQITTLAQQEKWDDNYRIAKIAEISKLELDCDIKDKKYSLIQVIIFLYINYLHFGKISNGDKLICFDEAQDYSPIEYNLIKSINENAILNLYGDIHQSCYEKGIKDWNELNELNLKHYTLNENYRNTMEITNYCNDVMHFNFKSMGRRGKSVETQIPYQQLNTVINNKINQKRTVALIFKTKKELDAFLMFNSEIQNKLVKYLSIPEVKGIEYDTAIVYDKNMTTTEKYIAYTRALNELYIMQ